MPKTSSLPIPPAAPLSIPPTPSSSSLSPTPVDSVSTLNLEKITSATEKRTEPVIRTHDFGFLPIPKKLQWNENEEFEFTLFLNIIFGFASTFTVASLYYVQPILVSLAVEYNVSYSEVVSTPTLLQGGYATGLLLISPLGDLVRRRQLILLLISCAAILTIIIPFVPLRGFQVICYFLGLVTVTPQILLPLTGDLAKPEKRGRAIAVVMAGLIGGILIARVLSGVIADRAPITTIWYLSFGLQLVILALIYFNVPDFPRKNVGTSYKEILTSMVRFAYTEPVLIQSCLISGTASLIFSSFWVTSTFLLTDVYGYNSLDIGLMALIGLLGVSAAPFIGKLIDRLVSWVAVALGISLILLAQVIYTAAAGRSIVAYAFVVFIADVAQQLQQVSNSTRVFAINGAARSRLSAVFIFSIFVGQLIGSELGTYLYLRYGYEGVGALALGLILFMFLVLFSRGPHLPKEKGFGYAGGWELNKTKAAANRLALEKEKEDLSNGIEKGLEV